MMYLHSGDEEDDGGGAPRNSKKKHRSTKEIPKPNDEICKTKGRGREIVCLVYVPPPFTFADAAIMEALEAELDLVFCITEGILIQNFGQISPVVRNHLKQVYLTLCFTVVAVAVGAYLHVLLNLSGILTMIVCVGTSVCLLSTPPYEERKMLGLLMAAAMFQGASIEPLIDLAIHFLI